MNNIYKTQADFPSQTADEEAFLTGTECTKAEDKTRQEDATFADINNILDRFGIQSLIAKVGAKYERRDENLDLQTALHAVHTARMMYAELPDKLKERYPTLPALLAAMERGEFILNLDLPKDAEPAPPVLPA